MASSGVHVVASVNKKDKGLRGRKSHLVSPLPYPSQSRAAAAAQRNATQRSGGDHIEA